MAGMACHSWAVAFHWQMRLPIHGRVRPMSPSNVALSTKSRMDCLLDSMRRPCCCGGQWTAFVEGALVANAVDAEALAHDFHESFLKGRCETVPVIVLSGLHGGEGKSLLYSPIPAVLGDDYVQEGLATGQFPMVGLETKKAVILNEWNFEYGPLPMSTQLLWFEGKPVPITRPQITDAYYGHCKYKGSAPLFVTSPLKTLEPLMERASEAIAGGLPSELTMLMRRLRVYKFTARTQAPAQQLPPCARCFAAFVFQGEAAYCQRGQ